MVKRSNEEGLFGPKTGSGLSQVGVMLPRATLRLLDGEAARYGWRKSMFLEVLLMHKLGKGIRLERPADAPKYKLKRDDWTTNVRWIWYLRPELRKEFDELRLKMGNLRPQAWIVLAVNEFVGLPTPLD